MKKIVILILLLGFVGILPIQAKEKKESFDIKIGTTTQDEVLKNFGKPEIKTIDSENNEAWIYEKLKNPQSYACSNFGTNEGKTLTVIKFDNEQIIKSFSYYINKN